MFNHFYSKTTKQIPIPFDIFIHIHIPRTFLCFFTERFQFRSSVEFFHLKKAADLHSSSKLCYFYHIFHDFCSKHLSCRKVHIIIHVLYLFSYMNHAISMRQNISSLETKIVETKLWWINEHNRVPLKKALASTFQAFLNAQIFPKSHEEKVKHINKC